MNTQIQWTAEKKARLRKLAGESLEFYYMRVALEVVAKRKKILKSQYECLYRRGFLKKTWLGWKITEAGIRLLQNKDPQWIAIRAELDELYQMRHQYEEQKKQEQLQKFLDEKTYVSEKDAPPTKPAFCIHRKPLLFYQ